MKVLVLGFPRTGTQSIAEALLELGCTKVYHMREVGKNGHQQFWTSALEKKYEGKDGFQFARKRFDEVLGEYDAVTDFPAAIFVEELIAAYPSAKIVLSIRDEDAWYKSMMSTLIHAHTNIMPSSGKTEMRLMSEKYHDHIWGNDFPKNGREAYRKHNEMVRHVASGKLLEYNVKDGWGPLCDFLDNEIPEQPFPRVDDWLEYKKAHGT